MYLIPFSDYEVKIMDKYLWLDYCIERTWNEYYRCYYGKVELTEEEDERIIKYSFDITIPGYILNADVPGLPKQLRSFYSAPTIDFSYLGSNEDIRLDYQPETKKEKIERHVLTDLTNVEEYQNQRGESNEAIETYVKNPFTNSEDPEFLRVKNTNSRTGESVISQRIIKEIDRQYE